MTFNNMKKNLLVPLYPFQLRKGLNRSLICSCFDFHSWWEKQSFKVMFDHGKLKKITPTLFGKFQSNIGIVFHLKIGNGQVRAYRNRGSAVPNWSQWPVTELVRNWVYRIGLSELACSVCGPARRRTEFRSKKLFMEEKI